MLNSQLDARAIIWDSGSIPAENKVSFILDNTVTGFQIRNQQQYISKDSIHSIWWRRPGRFRLDSSVKDPSIREFCLHECDAFFKGMLHALDIPIINNPVAESAAARKPLQLKTAQRIGLDIPKTVMSNDPEEIRVFWESVGGSSCSIYKAFTSAPRRIVDTRILTEEDLKYLDKLRYAPLIVQEKIEKGVDVRVNIFGENIFAAAVNTYIPVAELDWRLDLTATWKEHILPDTIGEKLKLLLRMLGLHYGCIDLRQRPDGDYVFLQVNPSGQFIFIEIETGQPLTRSFAELLLHPEVKNMEC